MGYRQSHSGSSALHSQAAPRGTTGSDDSLGAPVPLRQTDDSGSGKQSHSGSVAAQVQGELDASPGRDVAVGEAIVVPIARAPPDVLGGASSRPRSKDAGSQALARSATSWMAERQRERLIAGAHRVSDVIA